MLVFICGVQITDNQDPIVMTRIDPPPDQIDLFKAILPDAWSINSSTLWTAEKPVAGHCGVTTLVANDLFGGQIVKTRYEEIWHFYNFIGKLRHDFTEIQFSQPIKYDDTTSSRDEAFENTNTTQYLHLKSAVLNRFKCQDVLD